ncbi:microcephalin isoform X1 [Drosophila sulfurigaster albostrigata]|uniref:microcephalin isoform X1 n=2 Tax=Drosophila sulfurigaster albostrigata TaxID=89887 RepID=UPI002D21A4A7|nr:microcephalin isoform X1 [Drosophila sulfurigaster albostrigata]
MSEQIKENFVDLCTSQSSVPDTMSTAQIGTAPAIAHMLMTPKSRDASKPVSPSEHLRRMMPHQDANVLRMQRDLNSPSASLRMRALRALRSPNKAYSNFDVPLAEQSIITADERNPVPETSLSDILKDVIVYVEVRTGNDNRSEGVKSIISKLGAQVNDRLLRTTTHVVFKDGLLSTYKRAQSWNIPIVSILWIEACKVQRRLCEPKQFPISNIHMYEYPELYGKLTRARYMQPDSELNKRRKRPATPTGVKDQEKSKKAATAAARTPTSTPKQNDITRFFKPLSQNKHLVEDEVTESPATKLLNRITNGFFNTPQRTESKEPNANPNEVDFNAIGDVARENSMAPKSLNFSQEKRASKPRSSSISVEPAHVQRPQVRTPRRSSSVNTIDIASDKVQSEPRMTRRRSLITKSTAHEECSTPPPTSEPDEPRTRRRSSLQATDLQSPAVSESRITRRRSLTHISTTVELSTPKVLKKPSFQSIAEETLAEQTNENKTNHVEQSMDVTPTCAHVISKVKGRRTMYVSEHMEISEMNNENVNPYLGSKSSSSMLVDTTPQTSKDSFVTTKTSPDSSETPVPIFSSTRLPGSSNSSSSANRRRTIFSVDMELINDRINHINTTSKRRSLALVPDMENDEPRPLVPLQAVAVDAINTADKQTEKTEPKKRKLFTPNEEVIVTPPKSSKKGRRSSIGSTSSSGTLKRRRTLATPKPTAAVGPNLQKEGDVNSAESTTPIVMRRRSSLKKQPILHTLVHTNMHKDQVQVIHKAIRKLRGMRLDPTVTKNTTHLVSLEPRRTLNLLRGLMRGVWIVNYKWILDSMRAGKWLNEEKYELTSFSRAIEICRTERQAFGISYKCELFRYMETFYVSSLCRPITFNNIKELLFLGGAKITENRYKAKFIVGDKRRAEDDRIYLTPAWVLDSITAMQIQKFSKYLMKSAIVTPYGIRYEDPREEPERPNRKNLKVCYKDPALVINK